MSVASRTKKGTLVQRVPSLVRSIKKKQAYYSSLIPKETRGAW